MIAKELYNTEVKIEVLDQENENNMEHVIMRLHFDNNQYVQVCAFCSHTIVTIRI